METEEIKEIERNFAVIKTLNTFIIFISLIQFVIAIINLVFTSGYIHTMFCEKKIIQICFFEKLDITWRYWLHVMVSGFAFTFLPPTLVSLYLFAVLSLIICVVYIYDFLTNPIWRE